MMHEYAFDVRLSAVIRVKARSEFEARQVLESLEDEHDIGFEFKGPDLGNHSARLTAASVDPRMNVNLFEIDENESSGNEDVRCKFCQQIFHAGDARYHRNEPVCDDCWEERLKTTE